MSQANSPFKFLDSYQQEDAAVFFGREKETQALYDALSGVKHLLVYGPSGAGKTSLIECGLRNQFSDADWFALTIRRGHDINAAVLAGINAALVEKMELETAGPITEFGPAIEKLFAERYQPVYMLFDQFEELLLLGGMEEKQLFFTLLNKLIRHKLPCRILLIMREEFIGHLSEFEPLCPSIFQHRYRVEPMDRKNLAVVIAQILEATAYQPFFSVVDSSKLADNILAKLPHKRKEIELAHVQVFLEELWDRAQLVNDGSALPILSEELIYADDNLEGVLESFLKKQMEILEIDFGKGVTLELLATMITERFTKLQLSETTILQELAQKKVVGTKPIAGLLQELEKRRIIRTMKAGEETQYEISHDVLALVVGQNLTEEMKLREKAYNHYKLSLERPGLFTRNEIKYLQGFHMILDFPKELQKKIYDSEEVLDQKVMQEKKQTRKRLQTLFGLLIAALVALVVAMFFYFDAITQKKRANEQKEIAKVEAKKAEKALVEYKKAQSAKESNEFQDLEKRALSILEAQLCPYPIVRQMDSIFMQHYFTTALDSLQWKQIIDSIKTKSNNCR